MLKKLQLFSVLNIFVILVLFALPGLFYFIEQNRTSLDNIKIFFLVASLTYILFATSMAIKNYLTSIFIKIFFKDSNSAKIKITDKKVFNLNNSSISGLFYVILIIIGYILVAVFLQVQIVIIYAAMFIGVRNRSGNFIPNKILFTNEEAIIFIRIKNMFYNIKSYEFKEKRLILYLSDESKYEVFYEDNEKDDIINKFKKINCSEYKNV